MKHGVLLLPETLAAAWTPRTSPNGQVLPHGLGWFTGTYGGERIVWQFGVGENASSALMVTMPDRAHDLHPAGEQHRSGGTGADVRQSARGFTVLAGVAHVGCGIAAGEAAVCGWTGGCAAAGRAGECGCRVALQAVPGLQLRAVDDAGRRPRACGGLPVDPEVESQSSNVTFGAAVALLGDVFGIEGEWTQAPGFFQARDQELVASSSAQTFTGSLIVAMPRRIAQYTLRPYFVGGGGVLRLRSVDGRAPGVGACLRSMRRLRPSIVGGGVNGFFNERVGVGWDLRYFRSVGGEVTRDPNVTIDGLAKQLSFWRANMALVLRY